MAYLKPPALTRHLANPLAMRLSARGVVTLIVVARYREVAGNTVGPYFAKLPDARDHPVFLVG